MLLLHVMLVVNVHNRPILKVGVLLSVVKRVGRSDTYSEDDTEDCVQLSEDLCDDLWSSCLLRCQTIWGGHQIWSLVNKDVDMR